MGTLGARGGGCAAEVNNFFRFAIDGGRRAHQSAVVAGNGGRGERRIAAVAAIFFFFAMVSIRAFAVLGALLALGLAIFGLQIRSAVQTGRAFDRYFTVRGLSERVVKATVVIWPVKFKVDADDLPALNTRMEAAKAVVGRFLADAGIAAGDIHQGLPKVADRMAANNYDPNSHLPRYEGTTTLVVRSAEVDRVKKAIQDSAGLIAADVPLIAGEYDDKIQFLFDGVTALKPAMIQEATANARAAAEKFATDSRAKVGAIRKATQGVVEIDDYDAATPETKVVRVVTTVEFFIE